MRSEAVALVEEWDEEAREEGESVDEVDGLLNYLRQIGQFDFLSREEEVRLSHRVQDGQLAALRLASPSLGRDEAAALQATVTAARREASRLGVWSGLPADRPESLDEGRIEEDLALVELIHAGHMARLALDEGKRLPATERAAFQAAIDRGRAAIQDLGLPWSKEDRPEQQLRRAGVSGAERTRLSELFATALDAHLRLRQRPPADEAERARLREVEAQAKLARDTLVERNLRLVVNIAKRYSGHGLDLDDLTSFGNIGLVESAEKYDWRRGTRFSTYASLWIRQRILRGMSDTGRMIRIPSYRVDDTIKINRAFPELAQKLGRTPTTADVAAQVGLDESEVRSLGVFNQPLTSLESTPLDEEADLTYGALVPDPAVDVEADADQTELRRKLRQLFVRAGLDPRDLAMLRQRFEQEYTFDQIAAEHQLTRERVRQLIAEIRRPIISVTDPRELEGYLSPSLLGSLAAQRAAARESAWSA